MKLVHVLCLIALTAPAIAQQPTSPKKAEPDAAWAREYAATQKDIKWDPHFIPTLRKALPQHQWFWRDHSKFTPLPELAQLYIGVPGTILLDEDRYITADGCVPHVCEIRGMVWIDTAARPSKVVFVAATLAGHLLIFSSVRMSEQQLPDPLLHSMQRWIASKPSTDRKDLDVLDSRYNLVLATIVQPTGEMLDFSPDLLHIAKSNIGAKP